MASQGTSVLNPFARVSPPLSVSDYRKGNRWFDCMVFCLIVGLVIVVIVFMRDPSIT